MSNIKTLNIQRFRGIENEEIVIGNELTAIMGQNGAQKSTILGMLAQPFNFNGAKNIINQSFTTKFSEIFNFSEEFDSVGEHRYSLELFPDSPLRKQLPKKASIFNINSRKRSGDFCFFTFDKEENEFNSADKDEFQGLVITYKRLKTKILKGEFNNKKITNSHKKNELSLKDLLIHFKEDKVESFFYSSDPNEEQSKIDLIIELKATSTHLRFVTGNTNQGGEGNLNFPVIYLGLSRVVPLGEIDRDFIKQTNIGKMKQYEHEIAKVSKHILLDFESPDYRATTLDIIDVPDSTKVGIHTDKYSPITMSAGQDNIGKIISSIYSFKQLKSELDNDYVGGLLLIDELDATLYPGAQKSLINFMKRMSKELSLQIVFTTHSVHIVDEMYTQHHKDKYTINYLKRFGNSLRNNVDMTPETIYYDIAIQTKSSIKIPCLCEDSYGANMLKALIESSDEYSVDNFEFISVEGSYAALKKLMLIQNKYMQHNIYAMDGDKSEVISQLNEKEFKHTGIALPLDAPEIVLSQFLTRDIPSDHPIFQDYEYNKQQLTYEYNGLQATNVVTKSKQFIKQQGKTGKRLFQNDCENLFGVWADWFKENQVKEYHKFIEQFKTAHGRVIKNIDKKI